MTTSSDVTPTSRYFRLERLAEGVWAAIVVRGAGAWGNAGIVEMGDQSLVFDTFLTPAAARSLRVAAELLTGQPVSYVINSHYHMDHIHGNVVFSDARIIATEKTRKWIAKRGAELLVQARQRPEFPASFDARIAAADTPELRDALTTAQGEYRALEAELPDLTLRLPDITFDHQLTLHGSDRNVEVRSYGGGHTASDAFLLLPAERIAFLGDLLGVQTHPSFGQANLEQWDAILEQIEALDIQTVVPGHGHVGTLHDVAVMRRYLCDMTTLVSEAIMRGESEDEVVATPPPAAYATWKAPDIYTDNLRHLYKTLAQSAEGAG
jgi:cyclase